MTTRQTAGHTPPTSATHNSFQCVTTTQKITPSLAEHATTSQLVTGTTSHNIPTRHWHDKSNIPHTSLSRQVTTCTHTSCRRGRHLGALGDGDIQQLCEGVQHRLLRVVVVRPRLRPLVLNLQRVVAGAGVTPRHQQAIFTGGAGRDGDGLQLVCSQAGLPAASQGRTRSGSATPRQQRNVPAKPLTPPPPSSTATATRYRGCYCQWTYMLWAMGPVPGG